MESRYTCTMICEPGLFYATDDDTPGDPSIPDDGCFNAVIDDLSTKAKNAGALALVTGCICFIAFLFSFALCSDFKKPEN